MTVRNRSNGSLGARIIWEGLLFNPDADEEELGSCLSSECLTPRNVTLLWGGGLLYVHAMLRVEAP